MENLSVARLCHKKHDECKLQYCMRNAGSGIDLPKQKVRVRGLGRGFHLKNI